MKIEEALAICRKDPTQAFYLDWWAEHRVFKVYSIREDGQLCSHRYDNVDRRLVYVAYRGPYRTVFWDVTAEEFLSDRWQMITVGAS